MGDLAITHELPVDKQVEAGIHTLEVQVDRFVLQHGGVKGDGTAVKAAGVIVGDKGRVYGDGVGHVDVVGGIVTASQYGLPGTGDAYLLAVGGKAFGSEIGEVTEGLVEGEIPVTAEGDKAMRGVTVTLKGGYFILIGDEIGTGILAVHVEGGGILVIIRVENKLVHCAV